MSETPALAIDPAGFDLDGWLDGVKRLHATVTLYARRDLMQRIDEIVFELEPLRAKLDNAKDAQDASLAEAGADATRAEELRVELKDLWGQYEASGVVFELEQLGSDSYDAIVKAIEERYPDPAFDASELEQGKVATARNEMAARLILLGSIVAAGPYGQPRSPMTVSEEQLDKISDRFGIDQFGQLVGQARSLTLEGAVDAPFSQRVSAALAESTSG